MNTYVVQCPRCGAHHRNSIILLATLWTDGRLYPPRMIGDLAVDCSACGARFAVETAEVVRRVMAADEQPATLRLTDIGPDKLMVFKTLRERFAMSLAQISALNAQRSPVFYEGPRRVADAHRSALTAVGAQVDVIVADADDASDLPLLVPADVFAEQRARLGTIFQRRSTRRALALSVWQLAHDPLRTGAGSCRLAEAEVRRLRHRLDTLLDPQDPDDQLLRVEVARQQGDFAEAERRLAQVEADSVHREALGVALAERDTQPRPVGDYAFLSS